MLISDKVKNKENLNVVDEYSVGIINYYNEFDLRIELGLFTTTKDKATEIANSTGLVALYSDKINIHFDNGEIKTLTNDSNQYEFRICTKELPPPLDISKLTPKEKSELIFNEAYMTTYEDYKPLNWDLKKTYDYLRQTTSRDDEYFTFSSSAYFVIPTSDQRIKCRKEDSYVL